MSARRVAWRACAARGIRWCQMLQRGRSAALQLGEEVANPPRIDADVADPDPADRAHVDDRAAPLPRRAHANDDIVLEAEEEAGVDRLQYALLGIGGDNLPAALFGQHA